MADGGGGATSSARSPRRGVRILVLRDRAAPMVAVEAAWAGGARAEDAASNGAGALIAALLDRGTRTRAAPQIAAEVRALGGTLAGFSDRSHFGLRAAVLARRAGRAGSALLADCLLRPSFPAGEVDGSRRVVVDRARVADGDPARGGRGVCFARRSGPATRSGSIRWGAPLRWRRSGASACSITTAVTTRFHAWSFRSSATSIRRRSWRR